MAAARYGGRRLACRCWTMPHRRHGPTGCAHNLNRRRRRHHRAASSDDRRLCQLLRRLATSHEGERNDIAYWASCRFSEMVATGLISTREAEALIIDAAMAAGLPRGEAIATARSGLRIAGRS